MKGSEYDQLTAFVLTFDSSVWIVLSLVAALIAVAVVALFVRGKKTGRLIGAFALSWLAVLFVLFLIVQIFIGRDIARVEIVRFHAEIPAAGDGAARASTTSVVTTSLHG